MATVNKDFRVKNGLVVEGTSGTINNSDIITEDKITSGTQTDISVSYSGGNVNFAVNSAAFDAAGAAATAESNAKSYADGLASNYDPAGSAATAESNAKSYADGLASNYDPAGAAATAESNANSYTDTAIGNIDFPVDSIAGTTNEIEVSSTSGAYTIGLPDNVTIGGALTVTGDLTVNGTTTTLNTAELAVEDNSITLNSNVTGTPSLDAGIEVERGTYTNSKLYWNETANKWYVATPGDSTSPATETAIALAGEFTADAYSTVSDGTNTASASGASTLNFDGNGPITVSVDSASDTVTVDLPTSANLSVNTASVGYYSKFVSGAGSLSTSTNNVVLSWGKDLARSGKFTIELTNGTDIHVLEMLVAVDGSYNVYVTEYAEVISNVSLGTTDAVYNSGTSTIDITINPGSNSGVWGTVVGNLIIVD